MSDDLRAIAQAVMSAYGRHDATALGELFATAVSRQTRYRPRAPVSPVESQS